MRLLRITAVFAGVAALLTAAGIGRLSAHASVQSGGGRRRAMWVGARAHAAASAGLLMIAAIPHGQLPEAPFGWVTIAAMGAALGLVCGTVLGAVCGAASPVKIGDVMAAAIKAPGEALRQLLDPEDLIKLGAAVRDRTSQMFEGMFEPAERRPGEPAPPTPTTDAAAPSPPASPPTTDPSSAQPPAPRE